MQLTCSFTSNILTNRSYSRMPLNFQKRSQIFFNQNHMDDKRVLRFRISPEALILLKVNAIRWSNEVIDFQSNQRKRKCCTKGWWRISIKIDWFWKEWKEICQVFVKTGFNNESICKARFIWIIKGTPTPQRMTGNGEADVNLSDFPEQTIFSLKIVIFSKDSRQTFSLYRCMISLETLEQTDFK